MGEWSDGTEGLVVLPDGRRIRGRGLRRPAPADAERPEFGLYLTRTEHTEIRWESRWIRWPDYRLPSSTEAALQALWDAHERARSQRVEIACGGGRGRTGTAIALLARMAGVPATEAVLWTRRHYHSHAVETPWQRRWVTTVKLAR